MFGGLLNGNITDTFHKIDTTPIKGEGVGKEKRWMKLFGFNVVLHFPMDWYKTIIEQFDIGEC